MSLNCLELDAVLNNINISGIIKTFNQQDKTSIYMTFQDEHGNVYTLKIDCADKMNHICILPQTTKPPRNRDRFAAYLDSCISGGKIVSAVQHNNTRIIDITIKVYDKIYHLISRLWNTASNVILTDAGYIILELLKRYPGREEWIGELFKIPAPPDDKILKSLTVRDLFKESPNNSVYDYFHNIKIKSLFDKTYNELLNTLVNRKNELSGSIRNIKENLSDSKADYYNKLGTLIHTNLSRVFKGMDSLCVTDFECGETVSIPIKKELTPIQNAEFYYTKAKKYKAGIKNWETQLDLTLNELTEYETALLKLREAKTLNDLKIISETLHKKNTKKDNQNLKKTPGKQFMLHGGFKAYVSRSAREADEILKFIARGNDYWFHIRDYAGSHVIVKSKKDTEINDLAKRQAAMLALYYSKSKNAAEGDIYFTRAKYLHKPNTNTPGLVYPTQEKNIKIVFDKDVFDKTIKTIET